MELTKLTYQRKRLTNEVYNAGDQLAGEMVLYLKFIHFNLFVEFPRENNFLLFNSIFYRETIT
jgi:hypothetical protein